MQHELWDNSRSWLESEEAAALAIADDLKHELGRLKKKVSSKRVHDTRVALRRWKIVWSVLKNEGWDSKGFGKDVIDPLRTLRKKLGELRELEVDIKLAKEVGASKETIADLKAKAKKAKKKAKKAVARLSVDDVTATIQSHFQKQLSKEEKAHAGNGQPEDSAYSHFDHILGDKEKEVFLRANTAATASELHQWRIGVKEWRYLLSEFLRVASPDLVQAQKLLGHIHDIDVLTPVLQDAHEQPEVLQRLENKRLELIRGIDALRGKMPYGLRPGITTRSLFSRQRAQA